MRLPARHVLGHFGRLLGSDLSISSHMLGDSQAILAHSLPMRNAMNPVKIQDEPLLRSLGDLPKISCHSAIGYLRPKVNYRGRPKVLLGGGIGHVEYRKVRIRTGAAN